MNKFSSLVKVDAKVVLRAAENRIARITEYRASALERAIREERAGGWFSRTKTYEEAKKIVLATDWCETGSDAIFDYRIYGWRDLERADNLISAVKLSADGFVYLSTEDARWVDQQQREKH